MATKPFHPSRRLEEEYLRALRDLMDRELKRIGRKSSTLDLIQELLQESAARPNYQRLADVLAERMVYSVNVQNARSWRAAAAQSNQGRRIYDLLQRELSLGLGLRVEMLVQENARLIRSLPIKLAQQATAIVSERQQEGLRASEIAKELRLRLPRLAESRIQLIARTEVGKAESAVTQSRAESLGLHWYTWRTSEDQRVRRSHRLMDGVLVSWNDPPSPEALAGEKSYGRYQAGCIFNCRCLSLPLIDAQSVSWPRRAYMNGRIVRMTRAQFMGGGRVAA